MEGLENDNPLPHSFEITRRYKYQDVIAQLNRISGIEIRYLEEETKILIGFNNMIRIISLVLILILGFIGVMLMDVLFALQSMLEK